MSKRVLGVDFGGVITDRKKNDGTDIAFKGENYLQTTPVINSFESLRELNKQFEGRVYVVSKCGLHTELKTRKWMSHNGFYDLTGISPTNIHYCRERNEKVPICRWIGATHFIDDKLEVLSYLDFVPNKFLFSPDDWEIEKYNSHLNLATRVESWKELMRLIKI